jgi:hypothetical protein
MHITLDNDKWEDVGKKYFVLEWSRTKDSSAVHLVLEDENGNVIQRTEPSSQIIIEKMK